MGDSDKLEEKLDLILRRIQLNEKMLARIKQGSASRKDLQTLLLRLESLESRLDKLEQAAGMALAKAETSVEQAAPPAPQATEPPIPVKIPTETEKAPPVLPAAAIPAGQGAQVPEAKPGKPVSIKEEQAPQFAEESTPSASLPEAPAPAPPERAEAAVEQAAPPAPAPPEQPKAAAHKPSPPPPPERPPIEKPAGVPPASRVKHAPPVIPPAPVIPPSRPVEKSAPAASPIRPREDAPAAATAPPAAAKPPEAKPPAPAPEPPAAPPAGEKAAPEGKPAPPARAMPPGAAPALANRDRAFPDKKEPAQPEPYSPWGRPSKPRKPLDWAAVESWLAVWGTRIGALIIVLGLGYLLSIGFARLGALGKTAIVYCACAGLWGTGFVFEKKERYGTWGKILLAGGWAGFYLTTFLIHYLPQARLIQSPTVDAYLLSFLAAGMIGHSFRYRSEALSALTYFIAYITVALCIQLASETFFSLVAAGVLALSMLVIIRRFPWYRLLLFSLVASYGTHVLWASPLVDFFHVDGPKGFDFYTGLFTLFLYWTTFTLSTFLVKNEDGQEDSAGLLVAAVNFVLFVLVFRFHVGTRHPELRWIFMLAMAFVYGGVAWAARYLQRPRMYSLVLTIAVACLTLSLYFKLIPGNWLSVGWLILGETLWIAGRVADEKRFRQLGMLVLGLVIGWILLVELSNSDLIRVLGFTVHKRLVLTGFASLVFYGNFLSLAKGGLKDAPPSHPALVFSYAASGLWFLVMLANWLPNELLLAGTCSAILGVLLCAAAARTGAGMLHLESFFFFGTAFIFTFIGVMKGDDYYLLGTGQRIFQALAVILLLFFTGEWHRKKKAFSMEGLPEQGPAAFLTSAACVLAVFFLFREVEPRSPGWLCFSWTLLGLALTGLGFRLRSILFRCQGYAVLALSLLFSMARLASLSRAELGPGATLLFLMVIAAYYGLFLYFLSLVRNSDERLSPLESRRIREGDGSVAEFASSLAGTLIMALLLYKLFSFPNLFFIAVAWLVLALALAEAGIFLDRGLLRMQAFGLAAFSFLYALGHNLHQGHVVAFLNYRILSLVPCVGLLYWLYARLKDGEGEPRLWWPWAGPALSWFAMLLLTIGMGAETWQRWPGWSGAAWIIPLAAFLALGRRWQNRDFRLQGVLLCGLVFFWTLFLIIPAAGRHAAELEASRRFSVPPVIALFYALFQILRSRQAAPGQTKNRDLMAQAKDLCSWAGSLLLVALVTMEMAVAHSALVSLTWMLLAVIFFEAGLFLDESSLLSQGISLGALAFFWATLFETGTGGMTGPFKDSFLRRAVVGAGLYSLCFRCLKQGGREISGTSFPTVGRVFSWCAALTVSLLILSEVEPHRLLPPAWVLFALALFLPWILFRERQFLVQAFTLAIPSVVGSFAWIFPEAGSGPGRWSILFTTGGLMAAFALYRKGAASLEEPEAGQVLKTARAFFAIPAAALATMYLPAEFTGPRAGYLALALSCDGFALFLLGLLFRDRILRFCGIGVLAAAVIKVFYDLMLLDIARTYKVMAMIGLGLILVFIGWIYARLNLGGEEGEGAVKGETESA